MYMFWAVIFGLWLILPLVLIPMTIVLAVKRSNLEKELCKLMNGETIEASRKEKMKKKAKTADEKDPMKLSIMLIIGVLFVVLSGVIFVTTNWNHMSGIVKTLFILSMSVVFFTVSEVAEKSLSLKKTGFAFFVLGGIFRPVSVVCVAFFELLGNWFSFEGDGSYLVYLIVLAVTVPVFIMGNIKYKNSPFIKYLFGTVMAVEYISFAFNADYVLNYGYAPVPAIMMAIAFVIVLMIPQLKCIPVQSVFLAVMTAGYILGGDDLFGALLAIACAVLAVWANKGIYSTIVTFTLPWLYTVFLVRCLEEAEVEYKFEFIVPIITLALFTAFLHIPKFSENKKIKWLMRSNDPAILILSLASLESFWHMEDGRGVNENGWIILWLCTIIYFAVSSMLYRTQTEKNLCLSFSALVSAATVIFSATRKIIFIPEDLMFYFIVLATFILTVSLKFIWKNCPKAMSIVLFIHALIASVLTVINTIDGYYEDETIYALVPAGIFTVMTVFSYILKKKKWFLLSSVSLVVLVLYITKEVWLSISWWIYLLTIGMIFIIFAGANEYCRISGKEFNVKTALHNAKYHMWNSRQ